MGFDFEFPLTSEISSADDIPETMPELKNWMKHCINQYHERFLGDSDHHFSATSEDPSIDGRLYVARTVGYDNDEGFVQTGSSPSYFGGLWSLACCKKSMRGQDSFTGLFEEHDDGGLHPAKPVFIFTCSSTSKGHPEAAVRERNWLASVAMVTRGFRSMEDYGSYLQENFSDQAVNRRLTGVTTVPSSQREVARHKGDCHIDDTGEVCAPPEGHDHHDDAATDCGCSSSIGKKPLDYEDNKEYHIKCISEPGFWISWNEPEFATVRHRLYQADINLQSYEDVESQLLSVNL